MGSCQAPFGTKTSKDNFKLLCYLNFMQKITKKSGYQFFVKLENPDLCIILVTFNLKTSKQDFNQKIVKVNFKTFLM